MDGTVTALHLNVGHRVPLKDVLRARFIPDQGVEGDRHSTGKPERRDYQVLVISFDCPNLVYPAQEWMNSDQGSSKNWRVGVVC